MLFPTGAFVFFFFAVFAGFWYVFRRDLQRRLFLLVSSLVFYAFWDWRQLFLLLAVGFAAWFFGRLIGALKDHLKRKLVLILAVAVNILVLGFFKYWDTLASALNLIAARHQGAVDSAPSAFLPELHIALPVGISYFIFKALSYIFDVYLCKLPAVNRPLDVLVYVSFFPQLASGPIAHAADFLPQIPGVAAVGADIHARPIRAGRAGVLIVSGLFKKLVLANFLSTLLVDPFFADPGSHHTLEAVAAFFGYAVVIYSDFSGYSDLAIAVALLLGFDTLPNFNRPYAATSVTDFWRRWHISFSSWLREYLYFSLGGSRFGLGRALFALVVTMILAGIWHGAAWTFVIWGAMQGLALAFERLSGFAQGRDMSTLRLVLQRFLTFLFVCLSWLVFRAESLNAPLVWFTALGNISTPLSLINPLVLILLLTGIAMHQIPDSWRVKSEALWYTVPLPVQGLLIGIFLCAMTVIAMSGVPPFIYFQF